MQPPTGSRQLYERALGVMPGGNTRTTVYVPPHPLYAAYGRGCYVVDCDGNERLDLANNYTTLLHGHAHPAINTAVTAQLTRGSSFGMPTAAEVDLAAALVARLPAVEQIRFTNSGTEAVMMAVRCARAFTGRPKIAKFEGAYHGSHEAVAVSVVPPADAWGPPEAPATVQAGRGTPVGVLRDVVVLPFGDTAACTRLIEQHAGELAAVLLDPMPSRVALQPAPAPFLQSLSALTRAHGILLISDEVMCFRIGYHGAHGTLGYQPDLVTLGKAIGGGLPVGAVAGSAQVMAVFDPRPPGPAVMHGGTFNANPLTMAAGLATLDLWTPEAVERLAALSARLRQGAKRAFASTGVPGQVVGAGSLFRIHATARPLQDYRSTVLSAAEQKVWQHIYHYLLDNGVFITYDLIGCLSTPMTEAEVDGFVAVLTEALRTAPV